MKLGSSWRGMGGDWSSAFPDAFPFYTIHDSVRGYKHFVETAISLSVNDGSDDSDIQDDE